MERKIPEDIGEDNCRAERMDVVDGPLKHTFLCCITYKNGHGWLELNFFKRNKNIM